MSSRREWTGWFAIYLPEQGDDDVPLALSLQYTLDVSPGPNEIPRALTELHRRWVADGSDVLGDTSRFPRDRPMIVKPRLECSCDGRVLTLEEVEAISPTTAEGRAAASWQPGRPMLGYSVAPSGHSGLGTRSEN